MGNQFNVAKSKEPGTSLDGMQGPKQAIHFFNENSTFAALKPDQTVSNAGQVLLSLDAKFFEQGCVFHPSPWAIWLTKVFCGIREAFAM
jgi:hypothetical protein